jgi:hypothetical protein
MRNLRVQGEIWPTLLYSFVLTAPTPSDDWFGSATVSNRRRKHRPPYHSPPRPQTKPPLLTVDKSPRLPRPAASEVVNGFRREQASFSNEAVMPGGCRRPVAGRFRWRVLGTENHPVDVTVTYVLLTAIICAPKSKLSRDLVISSEAD